MRDSKKPIEPKVSLRIQHPRFKLLKVAHLPQDVKYIAVKPGPIPEL